MRGELSKSRYCKGVRCSKILWLDEHKPEMASNEDLTDVIEVGIMVGELARGYFGEYSLVQFHPSKEAMVDETVRLLEDGSKCIAEASFLYDGCFCSVDILRKTESGYDLIEVKSSTEVKLEHIYDVSYQYYVLFKSGIPVNKVYIMHINNQYVRQGDIDLQGLFVMEDCTDIVREKQTFVEQKIHDIREYLQFEEEPEKDIDICCDKPEECAYYNYCRRLLPNESIFDIKNLRTSQKYKIYKDGIVSFEDIIRVRPKITDKQMRQVETAYYHKSDHIEKNKIKEFLDTLSYPLYHLDFETYSPVIPDFDNMHPYAKVPFQYSIHVEKGDGTLEHLEFLAEAGSDPRRLLAESLVKDIPENTCVLAFNMGFEKSVIRSLAELYDDLSDHLLNIRENIHDLMIPFSNQYYYSEAMKGSYSIKYVLPALFPDDPELDYHNLEGIHHGGEAMSAFVNMQKMSPEEVEITRKNLLKYCGLDTFAMVKVLKKLREAVKEE